MNNKKVNNTNGMQHTIYMKYAIGDIVYCVDKDNIISKYRIDGISVSEGKFTNARDYDDGSFLPPTGFYISYKLHKDGDILGFDTTVKEKDIYTKQDIINML